MFTGPQLHLMLNHLPIVGFFLITAFLIFTLFIQTVDYKRLALISVGIIGLLSLPAFFTGEPAEEGVEHLSGISEALIEEHEEAAELALIFALVTAGVATVSWVLSRKNDAILRWAMPVVTLAAICTSGTMAWVGHEGGKIRHPEIRGADSANKIDASYQNTTDSDDDDD